MSDVHLNHPQKVDYQLIKSLSPKEVGDFKNLINSSLA